MNATSGINPTTEARSRASDMRGADQRARLRVVAQEFESLLMNTLMRSMRETVPQSDLIDNEGEIRFYNQMFDDALAQQTAAGPSGLGIAEMIERQYAPFLAGGEDGGEEGGAAGGVPALAAPVPTATAEQGAAAYRRAAIQPVIREALAAAERPDDLRERVASVGGAVADTLDRYETEIRRASDETGVEPELLLAVIARESGGRAEAVSGKGARGLMQLMPATAREVGVEDIHDPAQNIAGGARYLSRLRERFGDSLDLVLAGYNAGPGTVSRAGDRVPDYPETVNYVNEVTSLYDRLAGRESARAQ